MVKIITAIPRNDYSIYIELSNGKTGTFDVSPYLDKGIFAELKELNYFFKVKTRGRAIHWPHDQDFSADTIEIEMVDKKCADGEKNVELNL